MTSPTTTQPSHVEPDPAAVNEYLMQQLTAQIKETALTWGALQKVHQERDAARAEAEQLRAEIALLRQADTERAEIMARNRKDLADEMGRSTEILRDGR